jgi:glycosyltransferase 2 family protein
VRRRCGRLHTGKIFMNRQTLINLLKLAVGVGLLVFLYLQLEDPQALWQQIAAANKTLLALGALCYASAVALNGLKWGILLRAAGVEVPRSRLLSYQWIAEFFNNFFPAQVGGDVVRGYEVAVATHRTADAAASVLIDRFIGLLVFMSAAVVGSWAVLLFGRPDGTPFSQEQTVLLRVVAIGSTLFTLVLLIVLLALLSRRLKRFGERILLALPLSRRTVPVWNKMGAAFNVYRDKYRALAWAAMGSVAIVILTSVNIWLISRAIEPGTISMLEVLVINPIIVFVALMIPLSPGGLGVRQGAFAATFLLMGAGGGLGFAVGLLQQFIGYVVSLPGAFIWMRGRRGAQAPQPQASVSDL